MREDALAGSPRQRWPGDGAGSSRPKAAESLVVRVDNAHGDGAPRARSPEV